MGGRLTCGIWLLEGVFSPMLEGGGRCEGGGTCIEVGGGAAENGVLCRCAVGGGEINAGWEVGGG